MHMRSALRFFLLRTPNRPRTFTTRPRRIPTFISIWDPSKSAPVHSISPCPPAAQCQTPLAWNRETLRDTEELIVHHDEEKTKNDTQCGNSRAWGWRHSDVESVVRQLNLCIHAAARDISNEEINVRLWRAYMAAKRCVLKLPSMMPDRAWDILWASEMFYCRSIPRKRRANARPNLKTLHQDMQSVGKFYTVQRRVAYLMDIFRSGKQEQALSEWEGDRARSDREDRQDYKPEHLECGVYMYAHAGRVDRAHKVMEELYRLYPAWDRSIMMQVFRSATYLEPEKHRRLAYNVYLQMREAMKEPGLEFYDACFSGFLEAQHIEHSRAVFKDMVVKGLIAVDLSEEQINGTLRRLNMLYRLGTDIVKMTSISLHAINILPPSYHPHLFGDLMRSAVIMSAPEAISEILLLLLKRGFEPEAFHCNMIIRALLRKDKRSYGLKAETIGWQMIEALRQKGLPTFRRANAADAIAQTKSVEPAWITSLDEMPSPKMPQANATTFALLIRHHASQGGWEAVDYLRRRMKELSMPPNTDVLNALMDIQYHQGNFNTVWELYTSITRVPEGTLGVFPDGATFRCLWKTIRLTLGDANAQEHNTLPSPRCFFAENVRWLMLIRSRHDAERFRIGYAAPGHGRICNLILHSFGLTQDLPGSLVALHALRKYFDIFPSDKAASILQRHMSWVDMSHGDQSAQSQFDLHSMSRFKREQMTQIYGILKNARLKRMNMTDDQLENLSLEDAGDFSLNLLSEFVRVVMKRTHTPEVVESLINDAKTEFGLPDMSTGDMDANSTV